MPLVQGRPNLDIRLLNLPIITEFWFHNPPIDKTVPILGNKPSLYNYYLILLGPCHAIGQDRT
jgi:hypothetical protein